MSDVTHFTDKNFIKNLEAQEKFSAIGELARVFDGTKICRDIDALVVALTEREKIMSTGIGFSLAIPHAKIPPVEKMAFAIGISRDGIPFDSMDGELVHLIIMVVAGEQQHKEYLRLLAKIMAIVKNQSIRQTLISANSADEILAILRTQEP